MLPVLPPQVCLELNQMYHCNLTKVGCISCQLFSQVTIVRLVNFSFCAISTSKIVAKLDIYGRIPPLVLCTTLLVLATIQTLKEAVMMYKATKHWQPNQYMQHLVRDGVLYFLVYVSLSPCLSFPFVTLLSITYSKTNRSFLFF